MDPYVESAEDPAISESLGLPKALRRSGRGRMARAGALVLIVGLPLAVGGRVIWTELQALREEERRVANSAVIGYPNIQPAFSLAQRPEPWMRADGDAVLVWAGWHGRKGHGWFRIQLGDFDRRAIGDPIGRDVSRAIDYPMVENGGGPIWERIPWAADVFGVDVGQSACAYPMAVLDKVLIVNDVIEERPYLVHLEPFRPGTPVAIYDARLDGRRITMGSSGFTLKGSHVLYDRGTESLWADDGRAMTAFSGKHKGKSLPLAAQLDAVDWGAWRADHPKSRLLVGSVDRKRGTPSE